MRFPFRPTRFVIVGLVATNWLRAAELPRPAPQSTFASVVALAAAQHIPLQGFDRACDPQTLRPGDTLTVLFTLFDNGHARQWLAGIKVVPLSEEERSAKPRDDVIYSGTGNEYRLPSAPAAFELRMFGPMRDTDASTSNRPAEAVREEDARFLVQQDFLSFGFDRYCEMVLRLRTVGQEPRLGIMTGRFSDKAITWFKQWAAEAKFTPEDELVCVKQAFALVEFLKIAQHTPGLAEIARATIDFPSIWTVLRTWSFGASFNFDFKNVQKLDGKPFGIESSTVYVLPFGLTMFGKKVAKGTWLATAARPPLLASAGVLGLTVGPPDNNGKYLELRVIAARNAVP